MPSVPARYDSSSLAREQELSALYAIAAAKRQRFRAFRTIGSGSESVVRAAVDMQTGRQVAIKTMTKPALPFLPRGMRPTESFERAQAEREHFSHELRRKYEALRELRHPGLIELVDFYETPEKVYIVKELGEMDLQTYLTARGGRLPEQDQRTVLRRLLEVLAFCHANGIAHRDLKPSNIMLRNSRDLSSLALTDFSTTFVTESTAPRSPNHPMMKTLVGTPFYLAAEVVRGQLYNEKVDMFSLGCIAFQLAFGRTPFQDATSFVELYSRIVSNAWTFPEGPGNLTSPLFKDFVSKLLTGDPEIRLSAQEALLHPWLIPPRPSLERKLSGITVVFVEGELRPVVRCPMQGMNASMHMQGLEDDYQRSCQLMAG